MSGRKEQNKNNCNAEPRSSLIGYITINHVYGKSDGCRKSTAKIFERNALSSVHGLMDALVMFSRYRVKRDSDGGWSKGDVTAMCFRTVFPVSEQSVSVVAFAVW